MIFEKCIKSLPPRAEILVVNNDYMLLAEKRNSGADRATRDYLLFCDDDNQIIYNSVPKMVSLMEARKDIGIIGMVGTYGFSLLPKICDSGSFRHLISGFTLDKHINKYLYSLSKPYDVDEVANVFMIRKSLFKSLGGFDQERFPIDLDEADLCRRAKKAGYRVVMLPGAVAVHSCQTYSRIPDFRRPMNAYFMGRNRVLFQRKHLTKFQLLVYFIFFLPVFILSYSLCLICRGKLILTFHFLKGVLHGVFNKTGCPERYSCKGKKDR